MSDLQMIRDILKDKAVVAKNNDFTFVNRLFSQFGESHAILLICKKILSHNTSVSHRVIPDIRDELLMEATDHDVTGSPLRHSYGEDMFNVTIISEKRNWSKDEENYFPLEKFQASSMLNLCLEKLGGKWSMPLFALCDGTSAERIVLLGAFVEQEWFCTVKVCAAGTMASSKIRECSSLMREHSKLSSVAEREVEVAISSVYEFRGVSKTTIDWSENERINFEGYLSLELCWNSLSFLPSGRTTSNYLIAEIAAGWKNSRLNDMWNQLLLLEKYLTILETYREKNLSSRYSVLPLMFPKDFNNPYIKKSENLFEKLNLLLSGDHDFEKNHSGRKNELPFENDADLDENAPLLSYLKELSSRQNTDFTDQLWRLIIGSCDYAQMTDCLHTIFEEIVDNHYKPQIYGTQPGRFVNLINDLNSKNSTIPSLAGSLPLELVIDIGMEKMCRDYKYLLLSANLADSHEICEKFSNLSTDELNTDKYRKRLLTMARIHMCLEFLILLENNIDCSLHASHTFFDYAMKFYTSNESPIKSFADLIDNTIYTLKAPGSNTVLEAVTKSSPSTWRATLSSTRNARKLKTTTHYSHVPIFPPNIYNSDDPIGEEENFHVTKVTSSFYQIH